MNGKTIIITGASDGMGKSAAQYFASRGANVVLVARTEQKLRAIADEIGKNAYVYPCDLSRLETIQGMFEFCKEQGLKLDGLMHCAGITASCPLRCNDISQMESLLRINFEALVEICKYFPLKKYSNDGASIVALSSTASVRPDKGLGVYSASKAAVNALVKSASLEFLKRRPIRINAIAPAMVRTRMYYDTCKEIPGTEEMIAAAQPLGLIEPEYIAYLAEFLMSEKARYISGSVVIVGAGNLY